MTDVRPYYRRRSLFAPLLIVAIGIVALLVNLGYISGRSFFWWFSKYWPLLLIFWGIVKFAEYAWARSRNEPAPRIGGGGVVALVFLVLFGLAASGARTAHWNVDVDPGEDWGDPLGIFGTRYEFTANIDQPMLSGTQVRVLSARGDITIKPSPDDQAHAFVHKYVRSQTQDEANHFNDATRPTFQQQGNLWLLDLNASAYQQGRVDLELQLPPKYAVSLVDQRGDVHISQMQSDIDIESARGDVEAEQIKGNANLRVRRGDITAKNITGNLSVDGTVSDTTVADVTGTVTFNGSYTGDIDLSHIGNQVRFKSIRTDLQLAKLDGELRMDRGDFRASALAGPLILRTQTKDIHVDQISGDVYIEDSRGDVEVGTKAPLGNVEVHTSGGEINLRLPERPGFQVDAASDNGEIQSDYTLNINNQHRNATASGTVGDGKIQVKLRTNRGTIQIHKD